MVVIIIVCLMMMFDAAAYADTYDSHYDIRYYYALALLMRRALLLRCALLSVIRG